MIWDAHVRVGGQGRAITWCAGNFAADCRGFARFHRAGNCAPIFFGLRPKKTAAPREKKGAFVPQIRHPQDASLLLYGS